MTVADEWIRRFGAHMTSTATLMQVEQDPITCDVVQQEADRITLRIGKDGAPQAGSRVVVIVPFHNHLQSHSGTVSLVSGDTVQVAFCQKADPSLAVDSTLSDCQLPAMIRSRSDDGFYGCWKGAVIVKHGPDQLVLQVEDGTVVPYNSELMFSPIGHEASSNSRVYADDGSVISGSDVRSRRIRVRAITRDVLVSDVEGTVLLVLDITRTLFRTA